MCKSLTWSPLYKGGQKTCISNSYSKRGEISKACSNLKLKYTYIKYILLSLIVKYYSYVICGFNDPQILSLKPSSQV